MIEQKIISIDVISEAISSKILRYRFNLKARRTGRFLSMRFIYSKIINKITSSSEGGAQVSFVHKHIDPKHRPFADHLKNFFDDLVNDNIFKKTKISYNKQFYEINK